MSLFSGYSNQKGSRAAGLVCVRCGQRFALRFDTDGCTACRAEGVPAALVAELALDEVDGAALWSEWAGRPHGLWRHRELLPADADTAVSLAEGGTPLLEADGLLIKDERRNPTGSFKDRFFSVAVSWARQAGADTVAVASSGNAAVSMAAYAAAAGLNAMAVTTAEMSRTWRALTTLHGARLEFAADAQERWTLLRENSDRWQVLTNTSEVPVSSLWVGIEGYKTIAYEIVRDLGAVPDVVTAPVSRGDGFMGMWRGFLELEEPGRDEPVAANGGRRALPVADLGVGPRSGAATGARGGHGRAGHLDRKSTGDGHVAAGHPRVRWDGRALRRRSVDAGGGPVGSSRHRSGAEFGGGLGRSRRAAAPWRGGRRRDGRGVVHGGCGEPARDLAVNSPRTDPGPLGRWLPPFRLAR
ncbi:threonine synthase [Allosaccharopolyspora coralli]